MTKNTIYNIMHPFVFFFPYIDIIFNLNIYTNFLQLMILQWIILRNNCSLDIFHTIDIEKSINTINYISVLDSDNYLLWVFGAYGTYLVMSKYYSLKKIILYFVFTSTFCNFKNYSKYNKDSLDIINRIHFIIYKSNLRYILLIPLIYIFHDYNKNYSNKIQMNIYMLLFYFILKFVNIYYYKINNNFELEVVFLFYFIYINYYCKKDKKIKK